MTATAGNSLVRLYRSRSKLYDFTARLYPFVGFRQNAYRKQAVRALGLQPGDTVVDVGCGTGLNFPLLQQAVGPAGRIVGVDIAGSCWISGSRITGSPDLRRSSNGF